MGAVVRPSAILFEQSKQTEPCESLKQAGNGLYRDCQSLAQSGFAGARLAFDEVEAAEDEAAAEDVVQSREPGRGPVAPIQSSHSPRSGHLQT